MDNSQGVDPAILILKKKFKRNDLEYRAVMECLDQWANPSGKLSRLLKSGALIRVTKGLYVFGPLFQREPLSLPVLANKIRGPSYVSLEWALAYYGLIPEGVHEVTSVTLHPSKIYHTPIGVFSYKHIHPKLFSVGVTLDSSCLIATKEKALTDILVLRRGKVRSETEIESILIDDFRIELDDILTFDLDVIKAIYEEHSHSAIKYLLRYLTRRFK